MSKIGIAQIENAFLPSKEIDTADKFAGRVKQVGQVHLALYATGANIAIIGNRGIGKTSLARQIINIASGDNDLLKKLEIPYEGKMDFLTIYFACGGAVKTFPDLLYRLLTTQGCLQDWVYEIPSARKEFKSLDSKLNIQVASLGGTLQTETESQSAITTHSIDTIFTNVVSAIVKEKIARDGILIVLDEFDRIENPAGFADFLKALSTNVPGVKFCLVGVAQDIQNLMKEHGSSDRLFAGGIVYMPPMSKDELMEIIDIAEKSIKNEISFSKGAKNEIANLAQGHPYMVHLLGKHTLRGAFTAKKDVVDAKDIETTLVRIAESEADPVLEGRYKKAVGTSPQRESVLRAMAKKHKTDGEILTTEAYKLALDWGVDNASQYVGYLVTEDYGGEIVKIRERVYRFRDSLFLAYVNARPRYFELESGSEKPEGNGYNNGG